VDNNPFLKRDDGSNYRTFNEEEKDNSHDEKEQFDVDE